MVHNQQNFELVHKLEVHGKEYAIFFHRKSHRHSFWHFQTGGWKRIADVYSVPDFLKYVQRVKTTRILSVKKAIALLIAIVLVSMLIPFLFMYHSTI